MLFYHPPSCRWLKTCVWEINPADFIKQKQKNSRKVFGSRSADETTRVFPLRCVFVSTQPLSISNTWLIADSTLQRNHRIIQFECENRPLSVVLRPCVVSPADTSQSSGWFLTWSTAFTPTPPGHDTSRPRTPRLPFKRLFEVTVIPQTCFLVGWVQRCSLLCHGFNRIQRVKYERKRWSTLIFDCES